MTAPSTAPTSAGRSRPPPTTIPELESDNAKLKAHGIAPVGLGGQAQWPDAFWWEYFALRDCSTTVLKASMKAINLSNPCFLRTGEDLQAFMKTKPFQPGFLGTAFHWSDVMVVAAWGLAGLLLATRFFSWEPRR